MLNYWPTFWPPFTIRVVLSHPISHNFHVLHQSTSSYDQSLNFRETPIKLHNLISCTGYRLRSVIVHTSIFCLSLSVVPWHIKTCTIILSFIVGPWCTRTCTMEQALMGANILWIIANILTVVTIITKGLYLQFKDL